MLIRMFYESDNSETNEILRKSNIKECRRLLYLFVDREMFEKNLMLENMPLYGKAIQINIAIMDGRDTFGEGYIRNMIPYKYGIVTIKISVYFYSVLFDKGYRNYKDAYFTFDNAYVSNILKQDREVFPDDLSIIDSVLINQSNFAKNISLNDPEKIIVPQSLRRTVLDEMLSVQSNLITYPQFYSPTHQLIATDDFTSIGESDIIPRFFGHELIDEYTTVKYMDLRSWPKMDKELRDFVENLESYSDYKSMSIDNGAKEILVANNSELLLNSFSVPTEITLDGGTVIYDTEMGINIKDPKIPFKKYYNEKNLKDMFSLMILKLKSVFEGVEEEFGSIRVYYTPSLIGDTMKVIYKDFEKDNVVETKNDKGDSIRNVVSKYIDNMIEY